MMNEGRGSEPMSGGMERKKLEKTDKEIPLVGLEPDTDQPEDAFGKFKDAKAIDETKDYMHPMKQMSDANREEANEVFKRKGLGVHIEDPTNPKSEEIPKEMMSIGIQMLRDEANKKPREDTALDPLDQNSALDKEIDDAFETVQKGTLRDLSNEEIDDATDTLGKEAA